MCMTVKLFVDFRSYKAGAVVTLAANTAMDLINDGKARIAAFGEI